jgi:hypothetical protein
MSQQDWNDAEKWVWDHIRVGEIADFNASPRSRLDPKKSNGWSVDRQLRSAFLRQIFCDKKLFEKIPPEGARIIGAWFPDGLLIPYGRLPGSIWLQQCRFEKPIDLSYQVIDGSLSLARSFVSAHSEDEPAIDVTGAQVGRELNLNCATVTGALTMVGLHVGETLFMRGTKEAPATFAAVDLNAARIDGFLNLNGATVTGTLTMNSLQVGQSLFMEGTKEAPATFAAVDLNAARIDGFLNLNGATVTGTLTMSGLHIRQALLMHGTKEAPATFAAVDLNAARIDRQIDLVGTTVNGALTMKGLHVGETLFMRGTKEAPATFAAVDLSAARVNGWLSFPGATVSGTLTMYDAHASVLHDRNFVWPEQVKLDGFTYDRLIGIGEDVMHHSRRDSDWYIRWLEKDPTYSPQPYEQLAKVLQKSGEPEIAGDVLYAGRERARNEAQGLRLIGMSLLKWTTGYGIGLRYFRCLWWVAGFTAIGCAVLYLDVIPRGAAVPRLVRSGLGFGDSFFYSLQKLIPFLEVEKLDQVQLGRFARGYFYLHHLVGYVLALFIAAGLSGLTQKSR